ncbi:FAD-dependent oxidoreductase [Actinomadura barringtoniae]|uniref:FAD-dependent oxidoreductase n=1 Tax=Actinomadura barringtoniae TaxID=1427535 RepID=A0A939PBS9_9ACTN|nr:FAD-dependent oxidoreductase [Actinomadura barringtoniae]MBO2445576.1 FAD-dependent oxidoreductase [Actinomadura barringtoniae]
MSEAGRSGEEAAGEKTAVLIVGGGLTGLSAAIFLARHGTPVILVERHEGALIHPRARTVNPRTAELFRQVGLEREIQSARAFTGGRVIVHCDTLAGPEARSSQMEPPEETSLVSPCSWIAIGQDRLEVILRAGAERLGADVRFGTELTGFESDDDGVTARIRDLPSGRESVVAARFLVVADGAKSPIRRRMGIPVHGAGMLGHTVTFVFEADLSEALRGRPVGLCHLGKPSPGVVLMPHDGDNRWLISFPFAPDKSDRPETFTPEHAASLVRAAIGLPDLEVEIVPQLADGTTNLDYDIAAFVAERFRDGPVFLAGDAAHSMPPAGAFGSGTGIQDAHNLAWKLAAVVAGRATTALLDTYEAERRPVALFTVEQATVKREVNAGRASDEVRRRLHPSFRVIFGYRYPVDAGQGQGQGSGPDGDGDAESVGLLDGLPGTRAPHASVGFGGSTASTIDLYGQRFVALTGRDAAPWADELESAFAGLGIDVDVYRLGADLADPDDACAGAYRIGAEGAVVVRPDGMVAWRTARSAGEAERQELREAIARLMCPEQTVPV